MGSPASPPPHQKIAKPSTILTPMSQVLSMETSKYLHLFSISLLFVLSGTAAPKNPLDRIRSPRGEQCELLHVPLDMCMVGAISNCGALVAQHDTFMHTRIQANGFAINVNLSEGCRRRSYNKGPVRTDQSPLHNQVISLHHSM